MFVSLLVHFLFQNGDYFLDNPGIFMHHTGSNSILDNTISKGIIIYDFHITFLIN